MPPAVPGAQYHCASRGNATVSRSADADSFIATHLPDSAARRRDHTGPGSRRLGGNPAASVTHITYLQVSAAVSLASDLDAGRVHWSASWLHATPRSVSLASSPVPRPGWAHPSLLFASAERRRAERRALLLARQAYRDIEVVMTTEELIIKSDRPLLPLLAAVEHAGGSILLLERGGRRARLARLVLPQDPDRAARCRELIDDWTTAEAWP